MRDRVSGAHCMLNGMLHFGPLGPLASAGCRNPSKRSSASSFAPSRGSWACPGTTPRPSQPAGHAPGHQTNLWPLSNFGPMQKDARSALLHHRHSTPCAGSRTSVSIAIPDRRHRRAGAELGSRNLARLGIRAVAAGSMPTSCPPAFGIVAMTQGSQRYIEERTPLRPSIGVVLGQAAGRLRRLS